MKDKKIPDYFFYCVNCGFTYGYLEYVQKEEKPVCPKCKSRRFKRCYGNLYGQPITPKS